MHCNYEYDDVDFEKAYQEEQEYYDEMNEKIEEEFEIFLTKIFKK